MRGSRSTAVLIGLVLIGLTGCSSGSQADPPEASDTPPGPAAGRPGGPTGEDAALALTRATESTSASAQTEPALPAQAAVDGRVVLEPVASSMLPFAGAPAQVTGRVEATSSPLVVWVAGPQGRLLVQLPTGSAPPRAGSTVTATGQALVPGADPGHPLPRLTGAEVREVDRQHLYLKVTKLAAGAGR